MGSTRLSTWEEDDTPPVGKNFTVTHFSYDLPFSSSLISA